jgi:hypothetical protein
MKMSDKRKFVVAPKSREIGPHVVGVKICGCQMQASSRGPNWFTNFAKMKMSDKRKFVVAPKNREIGPHVVGVKICVTKSWPVTAPGSQGVFGA